MWFVLLTGCHWTPPTVSSKSGMAGRVLRPDGQPIEGLLVESIESTVETDENGAFGLRYRQPDMHVHFVWKDVWYRRKLRDEDIGKNLDIMLPPLHDLALDCGSFACKVELQWDLADGLIGKSRGVCEPDGHPVLRNVPHGVPSLTCRASVTDPPLKVEPLFTGEVLRLRPPSRDVQVTVVVDGEGPLPADCQVGVDNHWSDYTGPMPVQVSGPGRLHTVCERRPARAVKVDESATEALIRWSPMGPTLQPSADMTFRKLLVNGPDGVLRAGVTADGSFLLPPLDEGIYSIQLFDDEPTDVPVAGEAPKQSGVVVGGRIASGAFVGRMRLEQGMRDGVIDVRPR